MNEQFAARLVMRLVKDIGCRPESVDNDFRDVGRWSFSFTQVWKKQDSASRAFVSDVLDELGSRVSKSEVLDVMASISAPSSWTSGPWYDELLRDVIRNILGDERASQLFEIWEVRVEDAEVDPDGAFECTPDSLVELPDIPVGPLPTIAADDSQITEACERFNRLQERREAEFVELMRWWASEMRDKLRKSSGES